ncbi:MAG: hypothetical protein D8H93_17515 [Capnocytophaga sp.]|jgi:hypothetical protein|uniref:hypothetical protein n=1 Tax=Capnocytophaga sp. oral taxon 863 TaxID=1227265 RepID=UPI00039616ED|nr:hypothetical protein [Capnocytophaga sp. oral taxon 863]ERI64631.1 hypothetical protein HMPREF1551_00239 [Capnocytophaga sp. oral taxon 863 str. F0517]RKW11438.1 MAG: hypothetical protein D8H93_17515 [Capnocytophaga sp.]
MSILKKTNIVAYTLMILGTLLLYLQSKKEYRLFQEQYILMAGLVLMVVGIYMLSKKIPPKEPK